jgi:hypothetical protein
MTQTYLGYTPYAENADLDSRFGQLVANVKDKRFGAKGDGATDDAAAINAAIGACEAAGGGIVYFPVGVYLVSATIAVPVNSANGIWLVGASMRDSVIQGTTAGMTVVRFGAAVADASGTSTNQDYYGGARDLWINAGAAIAGMGLYLVEPQKHEYRNLLVTGFNAAGGRGLYLKGSTTSGGVAAAAAPHAWRNCLTNVLVADCQRPCVLDNADENDFYGCNFGLTPSLTAGADSLIALEIIQGHNNRFFGLLLSGESTDLAKRNAYVGAKISTPTQGDNLGHQFVGVVAEGFDRMLWVQSALNTGCMVSGVNASICNVIVFNTGFDITSASNPEAKNGLLVEAPLHNISYAATRSRATPPITVANGDTTPSVLNADTLTFSNAGATSVTTFDDGLPGQVIRCRMDANTTLVQGATMKLAGGVNFVGTALDMITLVNIGGAWHECARSVN